MEDNSNTADPRLITGGGLRAHCSGVAVFSITDLAVFRSSRLLLSIPPWIRGAVRVCRPDTHLSGAIRAGRASESRMYLCKNKAKRTAGEEKKHVGVFDSKRKEKIKKLSRGKLLSCDVDVLRCCLGSPYTGALLPGGYGSHHPWGSSRHKLPQRVALQPSPPMTNSRARELATGN